MFKNTRNLLEKRTFFNFLNLEKQKKYEDDMKTAFLSVTENFS